MNALEKNRIICGGLGLLNKKEIEIEKNKRDFANHFSDSPDYEPYAKVNDVIQPLIVSKVKNATTQKKIIAHPLHSFGLGDIVDCYDCKWLITEVDPNQQIKTCGTMQLCQKEIKWQNTNTGVIHSRWATIEKPYFSNLDEDKKISVSSREFKLQMRYDEETALLDIGKRFMLEKINGKPKTYSITCPDNMTQQYRRDGLTKGFISINIKQDAYNPATDNETLMICDYIDPLTLSDKHPASIHAEIKCKGNATVRIGGSEKTFTALLVDNSGKEIITNPPIWKLDTDLLTPDFHYLIDGNTLNLKIKDCTLLIGKKIILSASFNEVVGTLEVEVIA